MIELSEKLQVTFHCNKTLQINEHFNLCSAMMQIEVNFVNQD